MFVSGCTSGQRGIELRDLLLADQCLYLFERTGVLPNPVNCHSAKGGADRQVWFDAYGHMRLVHYITEWRPVLTDDTVGFVYPQRGGAQLSNSAFAKRTAPLLTYLMERKLIHPNFTFHTTRKIFVTHWIESGRDLGALPGQLGWMDTAVLGTYWKPTIDSIAQDRIRFVKGTRRRAAA